VNSVLTECQAKWNEQACLLCHNGTTRPLANRDAEQQHWPAHDCDERGIGSHLKIHLIQEAYKDGEPDAGRQSGQNPIHALSYKHIRYRAHKVRAANIGYVNLHVASPLSRHGN
jgi:hypothetical protein